MTTDFSISAYLQACLTGLQKPDMYSYWLYVMSALVAGVACVVVKKRTSVRQSLKTVFEKGAWTGKSAKADYAVFALNEVLFRQPSDLAFVAIVNFLSYKIYTLRGGTAPLFGAVLPTWLAVAVFTVYTLAVLDLASYLTHFLQHKVDFFWRFHKVHHSAERLNWFTVFRQHPFDMLQYTLLRGLFAGVGYSLFPLVFAQPGDVARIVGVNAALFLYFLTAGLRHSEVPFAYPKAMRKVLFSPHLHQVHHSRDARHARSNLGVVFSLWDVLFGTYVDDEPDQVRAYGLPAGEDPFQHSTLRLYLQPLGLMAEAPEVQVSVPNSSTQLKDAL